MRTEFQSKQSFNARKINTPKVLRYSGIENKYLEQDVKFIEINPNNKNDIEALLRTSIDWIYHMYAGVICFIAKQLNLNILDKNKNKIYALTTQTDDLRKLNPANLIGIAKISLGNRGKVNLDYIQVNPEYCNENKTRKYKHIGSVLIESVRKKYKKSPIRLNPLSEATGFYKKLGFKKVKNKPVEYEIKPFNKK